jgi:hypothetical protein
MVVAGAQKQEELGALGVLLVIRSFNVVATRAQKQ